MRRLAAEVNSYEFADNSGCVLFKHATGEAIALECSLDDIVNDNRSNKVNTQEINECAIMLQEQGFLSIITQ